MVYSNRFDTGLKNIGFKLHYLFFYSRESNEKGSSFAENIEKLLHKTLKHSKEFKRTVLQFPTNNTSEWYLPEPNMYKKFIDFVLEFISAQTPYPEEGYRFYMKRGRKTRDNINKFMEQASVETIRKYRHDFVKMKRDILVKNKLSRTENELKKGSKSYYLSKLIKQNQ